MAKKFFSTSVLVVLLIACIVVSLLLFGCAPNSINVLNFGNNQTANGTDMAEEYAPPSVDGWVLPIVVSITGSESNAGLAAAWGFDYGVKVVNEQGGIRGVPVTITVRDAASNDVKTSTEVLSASADALIVLGPPTEALYQAGGMAFYNAGMPAVGAATDSLKREAYQPFAISCIEDPGSAAESAVAGWVKTDKFTSVCIFYSPATQELIESFENALISEGKQVVEMIALGNEAFDAASVAAKALDTGADIFYIDADAEDTLRIIKQLKHYPLEDTKETSLPLILCGPQAANTEFLESDTDGDILEVKVWASHDPGKDIEKRKAFDNAFYNSFESFDQYSLAVDYYQAAIMLKQAIDKLGLTGASDVLLEEREMLANYLYSTDLITTDQGDFIIESGSKRTVAKIYTITENGFK
jgi:ABC-type branched-subunit amino acid transport system substrate-binding protein